MRRRNTGDGFTLIELLVVVVVILMLSGVLFRVATLVAAKAKETTATSDIRNIANALEEYYAEYGTYPPVPWESEDWDHPALEPLSNLDRPGLSMIYQYTSEDEVIGNPQVNSVAFRALIRNDTIYGEETGYHYGLMAYLVPRERDGNVDAKILYSEDTPRDLAAKKRWLHYLNDLPIGGVYGFGDWLNYDWEDSPAGPQTIRNHLVSILDPWRQKSYRYKTQPPYQSYELWSAGPDMIDGNDDDIRIGSN